MWCLWQTAAPDSDTTLISLPPALLLALQTVTIKTLTVEPTRGAKPAEGAPPSKQTGATSKAEGSSSGSGNGAAAGRSDVSKVSASPFAALGGLGGMGSGVTVLGGGSSGGMLGTPLSSLGPVMSTARERAAAAARRVPSPEPQPRKEKKKKVVWSADEALVGVRWFRKVSFGDTHTQDRHGMDLLAWPNGQAAAQPVLVRAAHCCCHAGTCRLGGGKAPASRPS